MHPCYDEELRMRETLRLSLPSKTQFNLKIKFLKGFKSCLLPPQLLSIIFPSSCEEKFFFTSQYAETKNNFNASLKREWFSKWSENILRRNRSNKSSKCFKCCSRVELLRYCWIWKTTFHLGGNQENKWKYKARLERDDKKISAVAENLISLRLLAIVLKFYF